MTLIGGPNESGKSTLVEALHRGFFLGAKGNTEMHRAMLPASGLGDPEVEIHFELGHKQYALRKLFRKNGTAILETAGEGILRDAEAEEELSRILNSPSEFKRSESKTHWAHLWVWQETAGADPSLHASAFSATLTQRLQREGAGCVLQSALDQRVASHFRQIVEASFGKSGKLLTSTAAGNAQTALTEAQKRLENARARYNGLSEALVRFERAKSELQAIASEMERLRNDEAAHARRERELARLRDARAIQEAAVERERQKLSNLQKADMEIRRLEARIASAASSLQPKEEELRGLAKVLQEAQEAAEKRVLSLQESSVKRRLGMLRRDLAVAHEQRLDATARKASLEASRVQVEGVRAAVLQIEQELASLPCFGEKELSQLVNLSGELAQIRASLGAMGVRIEVLECGTAVLAGAASLAAGSAVTLLEATELNVGEDVKIRVVPGAGIGILGMRLKETDVAKRFTVSLAKLGVKDAEQARAIFERRRELEQRRTAFEAELRGLNAVRLESEGAEVEGLLKRSQRTIHELGPLDPAFVPPTNEQLARVLCEAADAEFLSLQRQEADAEESAAAARRRCNTCKETLTRAQEAHASSAEELSADRQRLAILLGEAGEAEVRVDRISRQQSVLEVVERALESTRGEIAILDPEQMERDIVRIRRSLASLEEQRLAAHGRKVAEESQLRNDGSTDPKVALAFAEAEAAQCQNEWRNIHRKLAAARLVHELFEEEHRKLDSQFTAPLKQRMGEYLSRVFGRSAEGSFRFSSDGFSEVSLNRVASGKGSFEFDVLSAGTREQTAAAFRLAVAEVLASEDGGVMPVIFDDAFANSDPERVRLLQGMLDLAAGRGLQIILLSCTPADYAGLGAKTILLEGVKAPLVGQG